MNRVSDRFQLEYTSVGCADKEAIILGLEPDRIAKCTYSEEVPKFQQNFHCNPVVVTIYATCSTRDRTDPRDIFQVYPRTQRQCGEKAEIIRDMA